MREQFFGKNGLTSTSANHVANLAKEFIQTKEAFLSKLSFVDETTQIINHENQLVTGVATPRTQFENIEKDIFVIANATQLIAWLREGLKEKQDALKNIPDLNTWAKLNNKEVPVAPTSEPYITEADIIKSWPVDKYNAYITAQTFASVYGELIHPKSSYSNARKALTDSFSKPHTVNGYGSETTVVTYKPAYTTDEVDAKFFTLQRTQREYQAKFNQYQYDIQQLIDADKATKDNAYTKAYQDYRNNMSVLNAEYIEWKNQRTKELADLKIVVPEHLKDTFNFIQGLGK